MLERKDLVYLSVHTERGHSSLLLLRGAEEEEEEEERHRRSPSIPLFIFRGSTGANMGDNATLESATDFSQHFYLHLDFLQEHSSPPRAPHSALFLTRAHDSSLSRFLFLELKANLSLSLCVCISLFA